MLFMQVSLSNHKNIESVIKKLGVQMGQLPKQMAKRPTRTFVAIKKIPRRNARQSSLEAK